MTSISELKIKAASLLEEYHAVNRQIEELRVARKATCKHTGGFTIKSQSYMEEGKMSSPIHWEEKICKRCGEVLATRSESTIMSPWSDEKTL